MTSAHAKYFIMATLLLDAIGVGLVFPIMPDLMARVGATSTAEGAIWGGVLMAAYAAMQLLFGPAIGTVSDAVGRRPVLIISLAVLVLDYVLMAMATTYWMLLLGRVLAGISGATFITATAYLADVSPPEKRAANFGLIGASYGIGFIMGPAIGGVVATYSLSAPFWLAAGFAALNVAFGLFVLPESLAPEKRRKITWRGLNPLSALVDIARLPGVAIPLICISVFEFANMAYPALWAFWLRESFGWGASMIGLSLTAYGIGIAVSQGGVLRLLLPRLGEYRTLMFAITCGIITAFAYGLMRAEWLVFAFMPIAALADMAPPTLTAMMSNKVKEDQQGMLQGVLASLGSISAIIAPLLMVWVFRMFADKNAAVYLPGAPFILSGLLLLLVLPLYFRLSPKQAAS